jgi:hypothetical protein
VSILNRLKAVQNKRPFSNLFPRGGKSEAVDFSKITVSLDFLHTFVSRQKCEKNWLAGRRKYGNYQEALIFCLLFYQEKSKRKTLNKSFCTFV